MIELLTGENDFELHRALQRREVAFDGESEHFDGAELSQAQLADIVSGQSLFSSKRLVVIDQPSLNSNLWQNLPNWLERTNDGTHIIFIDSKPDKRTTTYKWLKKNVKVHEFTLWTLRDSTDAEEWLRVEAKRMGFSLTHPAARTVIARLGVNQWELYHALEKLMLLDDITDESIASIIDVKSDENVFILFETALRGDAHEVQRMIAGLELTEDPYRVFGLLTSQALQLAALSFGRQSGANVAADLNASSYVLSRLEPYAARRSQSQVRSIVKQFAHTDVRMKSTGGKPWTLIEHLLIEITRL